VGEVEALELTSSLTAYRCRREFRLVDERGIVRLALRDPPLVVTIVAQLQAQVRDAIEAATNFGDVGRALPALYLVRGARIAAFEGLTSADQGAALAAEETEGCAPDERIALLLVPREA
jgi:hypothetical protein